MSDPLHPKTLAKVEQSIDEQRRLRIEGYLMAIDDACPSDSDLAMRLNLEGAGWRRWREHWPG